MVIAAVIVLALASIGNSVAMIIHVRGHRDGQRPPAAP